MKTSKPPEKTDVTPSKKKLKQARLPFKLITDVSPKPDPSQPRKRKLTDHDTEPVTKVGKICKENDLAKELVVISDDESKDASLAEKDDNIASTPHPFVKLVDNARKKKLQKAKGQKKGKHKSKKLQIETAVVATESDHSQDEDIEMVDVDVIIHEDHSGKSTPSIDKSASKQDERLSKANDDNTTNEPISNDTIPHKVKGKSLSKSKDTKESDLVICLDDSNNSCDVKASNSSDKALLNNKTENSTKSVSVTIIKTDAEAVDNFTTNKTKTIDSGAGNILTPRRSTRSKTNSNSPVKTLNCKDNKDSLNEKSQPMDIEPVANEKTKSLDIEVLSSDNENDSTSKEDSIPNKATQKEDHEKQIKTTPKRTNWNKSKTEEKTDLNVSTVSSKLDDSCCSSPTTPKQKKADGSLNNSTPANLTPKQLKKRLESAKKREEREKEKQERELKRQQEKEERAKQKQEKDDLKKREREEKEEQRKKEKDDKEKQKELEKKLREQKEEEKRKERESKEEQRKKEKEARDEEKRKRQEALELEKQEQELKKKKAAEAFANFFVPKQKIDKDQSVGPSKNGMLTSFTIKVDMRLAPTIRADLSDDKREALDKLMEEQELSKTELYLKCLKDGKVKPQSSGKTWPPDKDDDVMIVEDELPPIDGTGAIITCAPEGTPHEKLRPKMLSFHENRRPPYWGTWRKNSSRVTPRRPFGQDENLLDYEVDSDDDWEEEAEGESLDGSVCGSDEEGDKDDYEVDNEVFVPHGYLSDEEATMDEEDDVLSLTPETQKARLKHLEDEFESEMKKPTEKLKPRMYGLLWEDTNSGKPENCVDALWIYFTKFSMIRNDPAPFLQPSKEPDDTEKKKNKKKKVPEEAKESSPKAEKKKKEKKVKEQKECRKSEPKKLVPNQPGINSFLLTKVKSS